VGIPNVACDWSPIVNLTLESSPPCPILPVFQASNFRITPNSCSHSVCLGRSSKCLQNPAISICLHLRCATLAHHLSVMSRAPVPFPQSSLNTVARVGKYRADVSLFCWKLSSDFLQAKFKLSSALQASHLHPSLLSHTFSPLSCSFVRSISAPLDWMATHSPTSGPLHLPFSLFSLPPPYILQLFAQISLCQLSFPWLLSFPRPLPQHSSFPTSFFSTALKAHETKLTF
jgi:hypothetical protein